MKKSVARTEERFANIANSGRFCETLTGNPVYLADPGLQFWTGRSWDIFIPTLGFVYFNGWIFHQGRKYLNWIKSTSKTAQEARERELVTGTDWPMVIKFLVEGWAWPVDAVEQLKTGRLRGNEKYITDVPL